MSSAKSLTVDCRLHVYLEECKYKVKKISMSRFTNAELESDSDSDLDSGYDSVH